MKKSKLFLITFIITIKISQFQNSKNKITKNPIINKQKIQNKKIRKLQTSTNPTDTNSETSDSTNQNNEGYYLDEDGSRKKCYETCKYCFGEPISETGEMNCRLCIDNYYFIRNTTNCINETEASSMSNILILRNENMEILYFIKCYSSCQSCNGVYDEETDNHNCLSCNDNYYFVNDTKNCYDESYISNGYYLNGNIFYKCKYNCKTCSEEGLSEIDQKCTSCYSNYYLENGNCVLINEENESNKTNKSCNKGLYYFNGYCYKNCPKNTFKYISDNICVYDCPQGTIENNENQICEVDLEYNNLNINEITKIITSSITDFNSPEYIIKSNDYSIQVYDIDNEEFANEKAYDKKISLIDFSECGNFLKQYYQIDDILLLKIDTNNDNSIVNNVNFYAYDYNGNELDISLCDSISINIYSPIKNNDLIDLNEAMELANLNYDIFNSSDKFYNDLCTRFSSKNGTDVILKDRRIDYYPNISLCDDECEYNGIDYENMIINCNCLSKNHLNITQSQNFSDSNLNLNLKNAKNVFKNNLLSSNIYVAKCSNLIFNKKYIFKNVGFWIMSSLFLCLIILFVLYLKNGLKRIRNYLKLFEPKYNPPKKNSINLNQNNYDEYENNSFENENKKSKRKEMENIPTTDNLILYSNENNNNFKTENEKSESNKIDEDEEEENYASTNIYIKKITSPHIKINKLKMLSKNSSSSIQSNFKNSNTSIIQSPNNNESNLKQNKKSYSSEELFDLSYEESLIYDKRSYALIYWNYLELQHIIINTFILESFLELRIIKIYFLIFSFGLEFTLNALFYTDEYISDMYYKNGVLDFISNLPKSIYSFLVTILINFFLVKLSNSKNELKKILSHHNTKEDFNLLFDKEFKCLKKKLIIFFLLTFILMIFFWYYSCAFCAVYFNSQKYWALGGLQSFILNLITPFIFCIFISLLRYFSLRKKIKILYLIEQIINKFI